MSPQTEGHPTIIAVRQFQSQIQADCMESDTRRTEEILNNLVPYMRYFVTHVFDAPESHPIRDPDQFNIIVDSYFSPLQIEAAEGYTWCPERDTVISSYDSYLQDISSANDLFDFTEIEQELEPQPPPHRHTARQQHVLNLARGTADDSIGTFRLTEDLSTIAPNDMDTTTDDPADDDSGSHMSMRTMQTQLSQHMDHQIQTRLAAFENSVLQKIQALLNPSSVPTTVQTSLSQTTPSTLATSQVRNDSDPAEPATPAPTATDAPS